MAWPIPKNSPQLLAYMTKFMNHMKETGKLAELQKKWFGETYDNLPTEAITSPEQFHKLAGLYYSAAGDRRLLLRRRASWMQFPRQLLIEGAWTTLWISAIAIAFGVVAGLLIALVRMLRLPVIDQLLVVYISLARATPLVTLVLFLFLSLPTMGINLDKNVAAIVALTLNTSAFNAEIWRNAFRTFPREQREAAESVGMRRWTYFRYIMLPQMWIESLPALVNEMSF